MKGKKQHRIQYTIRAVPEEIDKAVRSNCTREDRSLNEYVIDTLKAGVGLSDSPQKFYDLDHLSGSWVQDEKCHTALSAFDKVDEEMWKLEDDQP